jgi:hypothetical protein
VHELGVAAGDEQRDKGKRRRAFGKKRREQVALEVVDPQGGDTQRKAEGMGEGGAHQQGPGEPRARGVAHGGQIVNISLRLAQHLPRQRNEAPDVVARGKLGDHPPVGLVHGHLGMHRLRDEAPGCCIVERDAGFVTGSLDPEDQHANDFDTIQPPSRSQGRPQGR